MKYVITACEVCGRKIKFQGRLRVLNSRDIRSPTDNRSQVLRGISEQSFLACVAGRRKEGKSKWAREGEGLLPRSSRDPPAILPRPIFLRFTRSSFPFSLPFGRLSRRLSRFQTSHQMATFLKRPPRSKKTNRFFVGTLIWQRATCKRCSIELFLMNEFFLLA